MKTLNIISILGLAAIALSSQSCLKDNSGQSNLYANAIVTVKPNADNSSVVLQLNDSVVLKPTNISKSPFGTKEVRALTFCRGSFDEKKAGTYDIAISWLDSILTKQPVVSLGDEDEKTYGKDPVEIVNSWETVVEDGYITLRFRTNWGSNGIIHTFNLVTGTDPDDPYTVVFRHNAKEDTEGQLGDGIVAFNLGSLPDTGGKYVPLTLKWKSFSGEKSVEFKFKSRE